MKRRTYVIANPGINPRRKSFYPLHNLLNKSPLKKKTYFSKGDSDKEEIKSFADLINTLVQQNRKSKIDSKNPK